MIVNDSPSNAAHQALKAIDDNDNNANVGAALTRPPSEAGSASALAGTRKHAIPSDNPRPVATPTADGLRTTG